VAVRPAAVVEGAGEARGDVLREAAGGGGESPRSGASLSSTISASQVAAAGDERLRSLDILRGFALYGMVLVHFHQKMRIEMPGLEDLIGWGVWMLVEQKSWSTFAFLFGAGFAILLGRLESRRAPIAATYGRRLAALAVIGIVVELTTGFSILFEYACWGAVLFLIRRWPTRALLVTAALSAMARPVLFAWTAVQAARAGLELPLPARVALRRAMEAAESGPDYGALLSARWELFVGKLPHAWKDLLPDANLCLFILGLLAVRHGLLQEPRRHVRTIAGWMAFGAISWSLWWFVFRTGLGEPRSTADVLLAAVVGLTQEQWLCFTWMGAVVLLLAFRPVWTERLRAFGLAGRMALTQYVLQAIVLDIVASGYGFALKLRPFMYVPASVAFFAAQAALSSAWLSRFRFGPLEWLWRTVTYASPQPLRRHVPDVGEYSR